MSDKGDEFLPRFAADLARLMRSRGEAAPEVAARAGLPLPRVEGFLAAETEPGALEIMRLAKALDVTPADLVGWRD